MKKTNISLIDASRQFDISELFFSITDRKGIITGCNDVFINVSGYTAADLLGEPHNIVRHPHMPQCVFKLLWDYLLSGREIGAYVKNLAQTGEYYWVFALASPIHEGFLSIRLKPSSPLLATVSELYHELRACEQRYAPDWKLGMQASTTLLLERIASLGFENYDQFMNDALRQEMAGRREQLHSLEQKHLEPSTFINGKSEHALHQGSITIHDAANSLGPIAKLRGMLREQSTCLSALVINLRRVAINSSIQACHIGELGRALGIIGEEVSRLSIEIEQQVALIDGEQHTVGTAVSDATFNLSMASLQTEMMQYFLNNREYLALSEPEQIARFGMPVRSLGQILTECSGSSLKRAYRTADVLRNSLGDFESVLTNLAKILTTIQFAYVTGKAEAAKVPGGDGFSTLLDDLIAISQSARDKLSDFGTSVKEAEETVKEWRSLDSAAH